MNTNKHFLRGMELVKQARLDMAEEEFIKAIDDDYDDWESLGMIGIIWLRKKQFGMATQVLSRCLMLNKNNFVAWNNIGNCYKAANKDNDAEICWKKCLEFVNRDPFEYADIYNNLATLHVNTGTPEKGALFALKAIELNPNHPDAHWNLALMELEQGNYDKGFDLYKWGFKNRIRLYRNYGPEIKDWNGETDGRVIVWGEQGIGDEIMFSSMLPDLINKVPGVVFDCHPRLKALFERSFPNIICHGTRKDEVINWVEKENKDNNIKYKICIGDLGRFFRRSLTEFPKHEGYLKADPERVAHYKRRLDKLGNKMKIGISWTGGGLKTRRDFRAIDLLKWEPILKQNADFISLQYTPEAYNTITEVEDKTEIVVHHWPQAVQADDYSETAALVSALDLVITVNTAVHHLAGGLGKECWTMTPKGHAWRYFSPSGSHRTIPWYPSVRQFQQKEPKDWDVVINNVALALKDRI